MNGRYGVAAADVDIHRKTIWDLAPPCMKTSCPKGSKWDLPEPGAGVLEMHPNGYGFLRNPNNNLSRERTDPFVPGTMIEKFRLREGVLINGMVQHSRQQQGPRLKEILDVDGMKPEDYTNVKDFDELTPINPEELAATGNRPARRSPRG